VWGSGTSSDWALDLVLRIGAGAFGLTFLLTLQTLLMRLLLILRERRRDRFLAVWKPLLMQSLEEVPETVPAVAPGDAFTFLSIWNYLHESLLGEAREKLNRVARLAGADRLIHRMLRQGSVRRKLMAVTAVGRLGEKSVWPALERLTASSNTVLSFTAMKALVHIDAAAAMPTLVERIEKRDDWPLPRVAGILKEAGAGAVSEPLAAAALSSASPPGAARLVRYLEFASSAAALPAIHRILRSSHDERVIRACLHVVRDPGEADLVRSFVDHPDWLVRLDAAVALGRIGSEEDEPRLLALLDDSAWWVRYRAAEALASLPSVTPEKLERLREEQADRFARDILGQVIAERPAR